MRQVRIRMTEEMIKLVDQTEIRLGLANPGVIIGRSATIRYLILEGLKKE